jgi:hypothetical protein
MTRANQILVEMINIQNVKVGTVSMNVDVLMVKI